ncbi:MAG TPA: malate synthase A [Gemmatimonadales bacterium]|nr:malate synthase A [Gemmatimonadales bacterium]
MSAPPRPLVEVVGPFVPEGSKVLTVEALDFVGKLVREFRPRLEELLAARVERRRRWAEGEQLEFLQETTAIRQSEWRVTPVPADLARRIVEITGPIDRKMVINALNSGADVFMADFEDATSPTWSNVVSGQANLRDAVRRTIDYTDPASGKQYALAERPAVLFVRPRGLHLPERHLVVDGVVAPGSLVDFGLYLHHNATELLRRGTGPYFYLPKLESHREARWWNDVFLRAQELLGVPAGSIRATVLIETLPAAFEMDEILYELRQHSAGLNCGRWDYIFSTIKARQDDPAAVMPDRSQVTMTQPNMRAYTQLLVKTCHRRGAHAMGGMAAQIPIKNDVQANEQALARVRADKAREAGDGHDGTWVAHPGLVPIARAEFESRMRGPNQLGVLRGDVQVTAAELLAVPEGTRTEAGLRHNIRVGIHYLESWIRGTGCVPLYHLMEDAATAEISRTQIWQWLRHVALLDDGRPVTPGLVRRAIDEQLRVIANEVGEARFDDGRYDEAATLFRSLTLDADCAEFLTIPAYELLD